MPASSTDRQHLHVLTFTAGRKTVDVSGPVTPGAADGLVANVTELHPALCGVVAGTEAATGVQVGDGTWVALAWCQGDTGTGCDVTSATSAFRAVIE